jgi:tetratricopeptide (TPR) repeat protein
MRRTGGIVAVALAVLAWISPAGGQVPTEADVYVDRGILAYDSRQYGDALQALQEAVKLDPTNVNAQYYLGLTNAALDRLPAAQQAFEEALALAPGDRDATFQLAVVLFSQQQYDKAEPLFRAVYAAEPRRPNLGYYLGFLEYRKQNFREALRLFRDNVPSDAGFAQVNSFYAGLTLSALGYPQAAREEVEQSIRLQPISPLSGPAERFRDVLGTAAKAQRDFRIDVKGGFFYDDNVPAIPNATSDLLVQAARQQDRRSTGEQLFARFEYQPLRTPDWDATLSYALLSTIYNDVSHYNTLTNSLAAAASYKTTLDRWPSIWGLSLLYDYGRLDDRNYYNRYAVVPNGTVIWSPMHVSQATVGVTAKDYMHEEALITTSDSRDALNYLLGITHYVQFEGGRHHLKFGYQFDYEAAEGSNWSYLGNRFVVGFGVTLPWEVKLRYDFDVHFRDYRYAHTYLPLGITTPTTKRRDTDMNHLVSLYREFPGNVTLAVEYLRNVDESNLNVYDYTRNVVTFNISWRY